MTPTLLADAHVTKASAAQSPEVVNALCRGFYDDPVFRWTVPDDDRLAAMLPAFFGIFTEPLLAQDETYLTADASGTALWVPPGQEAVAEEDAEEFISRVVDVSGVDAPRMLEIIGLLDEHHPHGDFYFLNLLAVVPEEQGKGIGSALLAEVLERADREGVPAYLDATSEDNKRLYERHGFEAGEPYGPKGGPKLFPMWRGARSSLLRTDD